jgi:general secretion pathway protein I
MRKHGQTRERGFSLLEVLVAFVILGLVLGTLMQIFSGGLRNIGRAGEYQRAVLLGQSKLATVGIEMPLKEGESSGEFDAAYRWQASIRPFQETQIAVPEPSGAPAPILPVSLLEVEIRVLWGTGDQERTLSMKTVRVVKKVTL